MDKSISNNALRFFLLFLAQVYIFKQLAWDWEGTTYLQVHVYTLFILLLPFKTPRGLVLLLAFTLGFGIDLFYESRGMHAGALVFMAYMRNVAFRIFAPREGYNIKDHPTKNSLGDTWFFRYSGFLIFLHLFFYYSLEAFTYVYLGAILLKTFFSWLGSMFFMLIIVYITNPKE